MFYIYDNVTKEYIGSNEGFTDPRDGNIVQPGFSTDIQPPDLFETQLAIFNGNGWDIVDIIIPEDVIPEDVIPDSALPTISILGAEFIELNWDDDYIEYGATAFDQNNNNISDNIVITNNMQGNLEGVYYVEYSITDDIGTANILRSVHIKANIEPPAILLNGEDVILAHGSTYIDEGCIATDNRGIDISDDVVVIWEPSAPFMEGTFTAAYTVTDYRGESAYISRNVTILSEVIDQAPPVINIIDGDITLGANESFEDPGITAFDNTGVDITGSVFVSDNLPDTPGQSGIYEITYKATDIRNVTTTATRSVTILPYTPEEQLEYETFIWKEDRLSNLQEIEVLYNGNIFQGDENSQTRMSRTITALPNDTTTIPWTAKDNTIVNLTRLELKTILLDAGTQQSAMWNTGRPVSL